MLIWQIKLGNEFTFEDETNNTLPFLDIQLILTNHSVKSEGYRKFK